MSDFYVGYQERAPTGLARFLRIRVGIVLALALGLAMALAAVQRPPAPARYEYGIHRTITGVLLEGPVPLLVPEDSGAAGERALLLVGQLKHGAGDLVAGLDGRRVEATGTLIYRGPWRMLELAGPPTPTDGASRLPILDEVSHTEVEGELVDTKCHLGAMNPGAGETHRQCAIRCLRGGIPAAVVSLAGLTVLEPGPELDISHLAGRSVRVSGPARTLGPLILLTPTAVQRVR